MLSALHWGGAPRTADLAADAAGPAAGGSAAKEAGAEAQDWGCVHSLRRRRSYTAPRKHRARASLTTAWSRLYHAPGTS